MNSDTGKIYTTDADIRAALRRGEPLEPIGPHVAEHDKHEQQRERQLRAVMDAAKRGTVGGHDSNGIPYSIGGRLLSRSERRRMARERGER